METPENTPQIFNCRRLKQWKQIGKELASGSLIWKHVRICRFKNVAQIGKQLPRPPDQRGRMQIYKIFNNMQNKTIIRLEQCSSIYVHLSK